MEHSKIQDMRGSLYSANFIEVINGLPYYCGQRLRTLTHTIGNSKYFYEISFTDAGWPVSVIALTDEDAAAVQTLLNNETMIKQVLKQIDDNVNSKRPETMDELLNVVHTTEGVERYGSHFSIIRCRGQIQGVRVYITGTRLSHPLPSKDGFYTVIQGMDAFIKAGWHIEDIKLKNDKI